MIFWRGRPLVWSMHLLMAFCFLMVAGSRLMGAVQLIGASLEAALWIAGSVINAARWVIFVFSARTGSNRTRSRRATVVARWVILVLSARTGSNDSRVLVLRRLLRIRSVGVRPVSLLRLSVILARRLRIGGSLVRWGLIVHIKATRRSAQSIIRRSRRRRRSLLLLLRPCLRLLLHLVVKAGAARAARVARRMAQWRTTGLVV